jgi:hypothetical protein
MALRRGFAIAAAMWSVYATMAGIGVAALGFAYGLMVLAAGTGEVFTVVAAKPTVTTAKPGGAISYVWTQDRHEACPGKVISRFTQVDGDEHTLVQTERPVAFTDARLYKSIPITIVLPPSVTPGRWRLLDGVQSDCLDRSRYDRIIDFEFTVTEP